MAFAIQGFWMILPFAGLELAALAWATYVVADAGFRCEVVSLNATHVVVEKGRLRRGASLRGGPESRVSLPRAWVKVALEERRDWYPKRLMLSASGTSIELGVFLAEEEKTELAEQLNGLLQKT